MVFILYHDGPEMQSPIHELYTIHDAQDSAWDTLGDTMTAKTVPAPDAYTPRVQRWCRTHARRHQREVRSHRQLNGRVNYI